MEIIKISANYIDTIQHHAKRDLVKVKVNQGYILIGTKINTDESIISYVLLLEKDIKG